jgi:hypothetical protein
MANFNSKETYLAARAEWKENYARITKEAREQRAEFNAAMSDFGKKYSKNMRWSEVRDEYKRLETARSARAGLRYEATQALADLAEMKEEAARQWRLAHVTHPRVLEQDYPTTVS